jgi:hypothetical protein
MPGPQPIGQELAHPRGLAAQKRALWSTAPAWRNLVIASGLLTSAAISAPIILSRLEVDAQPTQQSCTAQLQGAPQHVRARVIGFVSSEQVLAATRSVEAQERAKISPGYLPLTRVSAEVAQPNGNTFTTYRTMAAVPEYMTVGIGDMVELNTRYRDPSLPCHFIPWTINRIIAHEGTALR